MSKHKMSACQPEHFVFCQWKTTTSKQHAFVRFALPKLLTSLLSLPICVVADSTKQAAQALINQKAFIFAFSSSLQW